MTELNEIQYRILNSLTFVEPFSTLVEEVSASEPVIIAELRDLIDQRMVQVMSYDEDRGDYRKSFMYDADDMRAFSYVATRSGLDIHSAHGT